MTNIKSVLVMIIFGTFALTTGFNVDTTMRTRVVHKGISGTMFGYDVDMYMGATGADDGLLVGAPRAQTSQPGVSKGGAVFLCSSIKSSCNEIPFDRRGDNYALNGSTSLPIDSKSNQWFGATVVSSRKDGHDSVLACAPRYIWFGSTFEKKEPIGTCYHATQSFSRIEEFSPCKIDRKWGYHRLGYCQAGFSAALGNEDQAYISAPGAFYWGGTIISQPLDGQPKPSFTNEPPKEYDDTYMGYSTASGDFNGDQIDDVAVGIPRGANYTGIVALFDHKFRNIENITGDQMGSYFGACIAVTDLNDDGLEDLIIGAPLYTKIEKISAGVKSTYEIGKVYVYYQDKHHLFYEGVSIYGQREWSKFAYDVAAAGDLNGDGYNDFVVGAPYDGVDRRNGAVYIFNGGKNGIHKKFSQVIYGQLIQQNIETFGFSVAGGKDIDNNGYPDIFVGAYKSDSAILLKSRPVVSISGYIRLSPEVIKLEDKTCSVVDKTRSRTTSSKSNSVACTSVDICVTYRGKSLPEDLTMRLLITLDAKKSTDPRARFLENSQFSKITIEPDLSLGSEFCDKQFIYIEEGIRDKLSPISIHVNYSVVEDKFRTAQFIPVVDSLNDGFLSADLQIWRDCGADNICVPDLQLQSATVNKPSIAVGADDRFNVTVLVKNRLEHAYEAQVFVHTPKGIDLEKAADSKGRPVVCTQRKNSDEYKNYDLLTCDLGNPMNGRGASSTLVIQYGTKYFEGPYDNVPIYIKTNSTNNESTNTLHDNSKIVNISFSLDADLTVLGVSHNATYVYDIEGYKDPKTFTWDDDIGPLVNHTYEVENSGTSTFTEVLIDIYFPSHTYDGQPLLYIIDNITMENNKEHTYCELMQKGNINPSHVGIGKNVKRERRQIPDSDRNRLPGYNISAFSRLVEELKELPSKASFPNLRGRLATLNVNCFDMNCTQWQCRARDLRSGYRLSLTVESRLWTNSLIKEGFYGASISSVVIAQVTKLPYKPPKGFDLPIKHAVVTTTVIPSDPGRAERGYPYWIIIVAVLAGLALLLLLILLLWRCGFFKRTRPPRGQALLEKPSESEYYGYSTYSPANPNYPSHATQPYGQRL